VSIGRVVAVYGLKGWVKIFSFTEPKEQIFNYQPWLIKKIDSRDPLQPFEVQTVKVHGKGLIALPKNCQDRNQAQGYVGYEIWTDRKQLPILDDGEYYWRELEGLQVINEAGEYLGKVDHLLETGANVLVVKADKDSIDDRDRLIPYVESHYIREVDLQQGKLFVNWDAEY
jgi:16S rRNA processing protein RimM